MPRKKPAKPSASTNLVVIRRTEMSHIGAKKRPGRRGVLSSTRYQLIRAYEETFGNVSAACRQVGINRRTFNRWMRSQTPINRKFQKHIVQVDPEQARVDLFEAAHVSKVMAGDTAAIIFGLKTKGRHRGWSERPETITALGDLLERVASAYRAWLGDHPEVAMDEKIRWLFRFAENGKVPAQDLAKEVGIPLNRL